MASDRDYKNSKGERNTDFIPCVVWGDSAILLHELASKGILLSVLGRFEAHSFEDNEGNRQYMNQVNVNRFYILESRKQNEDELDYNY